MSLFFDPGSHIGKPSILVTLSVNYIKTYLEGEMEDSSSFLALLLYLKLFDLCQKHSNLFTNNRHMKFKTA